MSLATGSPTVTKTIGIVCVSRWTAMVAAFELVSIQHDVGLQADQLLRERSYATDVTPSETKVHPHIAAIGPTQVRKCLSERGEARLIHGIVFVARHEYANAPYAVALARAITGHAAALPSPAMNVRRLIIGSPHQPWPTAFPGW
jgi:hypothetical protein